MQSFTKSIPTKLFRSSIKNCQFERQRTRSNSVAQIDRLPSCWLNFPGENVGQWRVASVRTHKASSRWYDLENPDELESVLILVVDLYVISSLLQIYCFTAISFDVFFIQSIPIRAQAFIKCNKINKSCVGIIKEVLDRYFLSLVSFLHTQQAIINNSVQFEEEPTFLAKTTVPQK